MRCKSCLGKFPKAELVESQCPGCIEGESTRPERSLLTVLLLSSIPGASQTYLGQPSKGVLVLLLFIAFCVSAPFGWLMLPFLWFFTMLDAVATVMRMEERHKERQGKR